jgi:DMSO reductase anchor subunit
LISHQQPRDLIFIDLRRFAIALKFLSMLRAFGLPVLLLGLALKQTSLGLSMAVLMSVFTGLIVERRLFFADARHVVNTFSWAQRC